MYLPLRQSYLSNNSIETIYRMHLCMRLWWWHSQNLVLRNHLIFGTGVYRTHPKFSGKSVHHSVLDTLSPEVHSRLPRSSHWSTLNSVVGIIRNNAVFSCLSVYLSWCDSGLRVMTSKSVSLHQNPPCLLLISCVSALRTSPSRYARSHEMPTGQVPQFPVPTPVPRPATSWMGGKRWQLIPNPSIQLHSRTY